MRIKLFLIIGVFALLSCRLFGEKVDETIARKAALNWYRHYAPDAKKQAVIIKSIPYKYNGRECFHIFSFDKGGFVLVSANDAVNPVLGYGFDGPVPDTIRNDAVKGFFDNFAGHIDTAFLLNHQADASAPMWNAVLADNLPNIPVTTIGPLLTTTWDQGYPYNILCPDYPTGSGNPMPAGCTAAALAQILKYWNYPPTGTGFKQYEGTNCSIFETFNEHPYELAAMPAALTGVDTTVARILYHSGVASNMDYNTSGSGAYLSQAREALVNNFDYRPEAQYFWRWASGISDPDWESLLKDQLDSLKPLIYEGYGSGGHAWVCDGYQDDHYFHMNWGWSGVYNGYYLVNVLNPGGMSFNMYQGAVIDIKPANSPLNAEFNVLNGAARYEKRFVDFSKGFPASRWWDFGDGNTSVEINPMHVYDTTGTYQVTLVVGNNGVFDTIQKIVQVVFPYFTDINCSVVQGVMQPGSFDFGDYDNDGYIDLLFQFNALFHGAYGYYNRIFRNVSGTGFSEFNAGFPNTCYGSAKWCDFDNDNDLDCSITGFDGELTPYGALFENINGIFSFKEIIPRFPNYTPSFWRDLDKDGDQDLTFNEQHGNYVSIYRNIYSHLCSDSVGVNQIQPFAKNGDFDNDGDLDGFSSGIFINDNGTMIPYPQSFANAVDWGDFDGDGDYDVLAVNTVYRNDAGQFTDLNLNLTGAAAWFDFDNDRDLDVLFSNPGPSYSNWKILRNNWNPELQPIPGMLVCTTDTVGNQIYIAWNRQVQPISTGAGYTYNLYVNRANSNVAKISPEADIPTGFRKILAGGNCGSDTALTMDNLPNGTYYYGIQAINSQYKGLPFSVVDSFAIDGLNLTAELLPLNKSGFVHIPVSFSKTDFSASYFDPEADPLFKIKIVSLPFYGNLKLNGIQVVPGTVIDSSEIQLLTYQTDTIANDQFLWIASNNDGSAYSELPAYVNLKIVAFQMADEFSRPAKGCALGDYDMDLDADMLIGNCLVRNDSGQFLDTVFSAPYANIRSQQFVDYNGDGLLDLLFADDAEGLLFFRNENNTSFIRDSVNILPLGTPGYSMGDYNCDGFIDIIESGMIANSGPISESYATRLYTNARNGKFILSPVAFPSLRSGMFCFGDINNDGFPDLAVSGETTWEGDRIFKLYINNAAGGFDESPQTFTGLSYGSIDMGDVDHDGDLDLLACGRYKYIYTSTYSSQTALYINNSGTFELYPQFVPLNIHSGQSKFIDVNQDGRLDVILNGQEYNYANGRRPASKIYINRFPEFVEAENNIPAWYASAFEFGDVENDGDQDVLLSGVNPDLNQFQTILFRNTCHNNSYSINIAPSAPLNLRDTLVQRKAILSWDAAYDNTTPPSALMYNVVVTKLFDTLQLCAPLVTPGDSLRIVADNGNAGTNTHHKLNKKPQGTYTWKVEAIDGTFIPSVFSATDTLYFDGFPEVYDSCWVIGPQPTSLSYQLFAGKFVDYEGDTLAAIKILRLPDHGLLIYKGMSVTAGQTIPGDSIGFLVLTPVSGYLGNDTILWNARDGNNYAHMPATLNIMIEFFQETSFTLGQHWGKGTVAFGDFDHDDDLDIGINVTHRISGYENCIYKNNGGDFQLMGHFIGGGKSAIHWGDIDGDGDLDYSTHGFTFWGQYSSSTIVENTGTTFALKQSFEEFGGNNPYWGDYNGDNCLDYPGEYGLYKNNGTGTFIPGECNVNWTVYDFNSLIWSDIDNSGNQDLVVSFEASQGRPYIIRYLNRYSAGCVFEEKALTTMPASLYGSCALADYDGDNDNDLLVTGWSPFGGVPSSRIYLNNSGAFEESSEILPQLTGGNAKWADINLDGLLDIAMCGTDINNKPRLAVLLNTGNGFSEIHTMVTPMGNGWLDLGDIDNDGDLDMAITGVDSLGNYLMKMYRNMLGSNQYVPNSSPESPTNLMVSNTGEHTFFEWNGSVDNTTPSSSLAYNIYLRRAPDTTYIVSPLADLASGFRKVVQLGNASLNNHWRLDSLQAGTYHWSVQAIDNSFSGGPFAPEQTFTIYPQVPAGITLANDTVPAGESVCYEASQTITVAGNGTTFVVTDGGSVEMIAGENILYFPGTMVEAGGHLYGYISSGGPWCNNYKQGAVPVNTAVEAQLTKTTRTSGDWFVTAWPNPTTGELHLAVNTADLKTPVQATVFSFLGEVLFRSSFSGGTTTSISLENLPAGMYLLRCVQGDAMEVFKLVKQ